MIDPGMKAALGLLLALSLAKDDLKVGLPPGMQRLHSCLASAVARAVDQVVHVLAGNCLLLGLFLGLGALGHFLDRALGRLAVGGRWDGLALFLPLEVDTLRD